MVTSPNVLAATDEQLAERIVHQQDSGPTRQAAHEAFEELYRRHAGRLLAFLASRVHRSDLDEVHQDVWMRVWERLPRSFHGGDFSAWLYQTTRHYVIDRSRKKKPVPLHEDADFAAGGESAEDVLVAQERKEALARCLGQLERQAAELVRGRLAGESYEELCPRLGLKPQTAHKLFHKAKAMLKACVERAIQ
jgi:RNA polymerase sigma-70 factor (ECF subfamily)